MAWVILTAFDLSRPLGQNPHVDGALRAASFRFGSCTTLGMFMLRWRLLLGAILIGAIVALCWLDAKASPPGVWLMPLALVLSVLCSHEMLRLLTAAGARPAAWVVYAGNLAMVASN